LHEIPDVLALLLSLLDHAIRVPHGIRRKLFGIVVVVGRATAGWLSLMGLDQLSTDVNTYKLAVPADPRCLSDIPSGNGVDRFAKADVMIGMDLVLAPRRRIKPLLLERQQGRLFYVLEHHQRALPGRTVDPHPGALQAPADCTTLHVVDL
jgi:hypothetical protein